MTLQERTDDMRETLGYMEREDRYEWLIELGKSLQPNMRFTEADRVIGCQAQVWLTVAKRDGKLVLDGDSDALIVRGIVSLVIQLFSGVTPNEVKDFDLVDWITRAEISLSMHRMQGLSAMQDRIRSVC